MKTIKLSKNETFKVSGLPLPISPQIAGECLMRIYQNHSNRLTPDIIVKEASAKKNPLNKCFEWDDTIAGKEWRLQQARKLIGCVTVVSSSGDNTVETRAFISIRNDADGNLTSNPFNTSMGGASYYVSVNDAMNDGVLRKYTVDMALLELQNWMRKYDSLNELSSLYEFIHTHIDKIQLGKIKKQA